MGASGFPASGLWGCAWEAGSGNYAGGTRGTRCAPHFSDNLGHLQINRAHARMKSPHSLPFEGHRHRLDTCRSSSVRLGYTPTEKMKSLSFFGDLRFLDNPDSNVCSFHATRCSPLGETHQLKALLCATEGEVRSGPRTEGTWSRGLSELGLGAWRSLMALLGVSPSGHDLFHTNDRQVLQAHQQMKQRPCSRKQHRKIKRQKKNTH